MADETIWKFEIQQGNTATVLKNLDAMLLSAKERFDQVAQQATQAANNFKQTSVSMADLASKAGVAGQGISKLDTLQSRAAEAAKKLEIAQAQAALALKKAEDATSGGKASAEQLAVVQARAALAAEKVHTAETQLATAMQKVEVEAKREAEAMQQSAEKSNFFTHAIGSAKNALGELASKAESAGNNVASTFQHAGGNLLDFGSKIGMTVFGIQSLVQAAIGAGQSLLEPVMSAEQLGIAFTTLDGSARAASAEIQKLNRFADVTPFEPEPVQRYAAQLQGMKIAADKVIPIMTSLGDALYGIGHGSDEEMNQVVDILGKINIQGHLMEGDLTQLGEHGIDALGAIAAGAGKTNEEISQMAKDGTLSATEAIDDLTRGIEMNPLYKGGMAKQANSLGGIMSTLSGYVKQALDSFLGLKDGMIVSGSIVDRFKGAVASLTTWMQSPAFQQFASTMGERVAGALSTAGDFITNTVIPAFSQLQPVIAYLAPKFQELGLALQHLGTVLAPILVSFGQWLIHSGTLQGMVAGIVVGIGLFIQGLTLLANGISNVIVFFSTGGSNAKWLWDILAGIGTFLASTFKPVWDQLTSTFQTQLLPAWNQFVTAIQPVLPALGVLAAIIGGLLVGAISGLISMFGGLLSAVIVIFGGIVQFISGAIQVVLGIFQFFTDLTHGNFSKLGADLGAIWQGIAMMFLGVVSVIAGIFMAGFAMIDGFVSGFVKGITGWFTWLWDTLVGHSIVPDMINGIINWFQQLPGRVIAFVVDLATKIRDKFTGLVNDAPRWAADMINGFIDKIRSLVGQVGNVASEVGDQIRSFLHFSVPDQGPLADADQWMGDFGDLLTRGLNAQVGKIGRATLNIASTLALPVPSTPGFAVSRSLQSGGNGNSDSQATQYLAQIAMYLSQLVTLQQKGNGGNITNNFNGSPVDARLLNQAIQSLSGFGYEAIQRGAW